MAGAGHDRVGAGHGTTDLRLYFAKAAHIVFHKCWREGGECSPF